MPVGGFLILGQIIFGAAEQIIGVENDFPGEIKDPALDLDGSALRSWGKDDGQIVADFESRECGEDRFWSNIGVISGLEDFRFGADDQKTFKPEAS